jgi:hypothetical protein
MTSRQFLAVALMLATNYDERLLGRALLARGQTYQAHTWPYWDALISEDLQRIGAKRTLWLDVYA